MSRILVIRLSALGDFVLSFRAFAAIRAHHADAEITLLTTAPYVALAEASPWFDHVFADDRPGLWNVPALLRLRQLLRGFAMTYDLQTSGRTSWYCQLAGRPPWSGIARGCSHPQPGPARERMHTFERQEDQLRLAGVTEFATPDLSFLNRHAVPPLPHRYALLIPGASAHRPVKRWPVERYGELAALLVARGLAPVVLGGHDETPLGAAIRAACPNAIDLTGKTAVLDIFAIAAQAAFAVGNDTGPTHMAAAAGCPVIALFSGESDPQMNAPRGADGTWSSVLREPVLADMSVARVAAALP